MDAPVALVERAVAAEGNAFTAERPFHEIGGNTWVISVPDIH